MARSLRILGTRGVPATHGGFETFAEVLAIYLVKRGWRITVYCQNEGKGEITQDIWEGIRRIHIPTNGNGPFSTIVFDWKSTLHAAADHDLLLTLGYNTAIFSLVFRHKKLTNIINMDGIEWKRAKWTPPVRVWFWIQERLAMWLGDHLIADNPGIFDHLAKHANPEKITMIPYGAEPIQKADVSLIQAYGLESGQYATVIARPEPENSILEIVKAWSRQPRNAKLVILGNYTEKHYFQRAVLKAAGPEVVFLGPIYDKPILYALRHHCKLYIHGHQVGGTNPSLLEALGAANAILSYDNQFNRWVAGNGAVYFQGEDACAAQLDKILGDEERLDHLRQMSKARHAAAFTWKQVLHRYEALLDKWT